MTTANLRTDGLIKPQAELRIVSLVPSATEIVAKLGYERFLVGRFCFGKASPTHECDYPPTPAQSPHLHGAQV